MIMHGQIHRYERRKRTCCNDLFKSRIIVQDNVQISRFAMILVNLQFSSFRLRNVKCTISNGKVSSPVIA